MKGFDIRIVLADTQFIAREGLKTILSTESSFLIVAEAATNEDLVRYVKMHQPNVVIMDYDNSGFSMAKDIPGIRKVSPETNILIISSDNNRHNIFGALELGVKNFLTKECDKNEIIEAVKATARGEKFLCHKIVDLILEKHIKKSDIDCQPTVLSERENEIITLIAKARTNNEIASELNLSPHTISTHRKNIMRKLRVSTATEITMYAFRLGLVK